jgi:hypothetical protein
MSRLFRAPDPGFPCSPHCYSTSRYRWEPGTTWPPTRNRWSGGSGRSEDPHQVSISTPIGCTAWPMRWRRWLSFQPENISAQKTHPGGFGDKANAIRQRLLNHNKNEVLKDAENPEIFFTIPIYSGKFLLSNDGSAQDNFATTPPDPEANFNTKSYG